MNKSLACIFSAASLLCLTPVVFADPVVPAVNDPSSHEISATGLAFHNLNSSGLDKQSDGVGGKATADIDLFKPDKGGIAARFRIDGGYVSGSGIIGGLSLGAGPTNLNHASIMASTSFECQVMDCVGGTLIGGSIPIARDSALQIQARMPVFGGVIDKQDAVIKMALIGGRVDYISQVSDLLRLKAFVDATLTNGAVDDLTHTSYPDGTRMQDGLGVFVTAGAEARLKLANNLALAASVAAEGNAYRAVSIPASNNAVASTLATTGNFQSLGVTGGLSAVAAF